MSALFEELDYRRTVLGELILRRRRILKLDRDVVEVILNDEHLMSDMFTASEIALATLPMALLEAAGRTNADILVGGLGLGYTADAVLRSDATGSLAVVEYLAPLIGWHEAGILPLAGVWQTIRDAVSSKPIFLPLRGAMTGSTRRRRVASSTASSSISITARIFT